MTYILDTDICIYWLKGNENIERKALIAGLDNLAISFISLSELFYGAHKSQKVWENLESIKSFSEKLELIDSEEEICEVFEQLKATLEKRGKVLDDADLFIAACALVNDIVLVTNNEKHFRRIEGLRLENWAN